MKPYMSAHFQSRKPSAIRLAQIEFAKRTDKVNAINVAIGNVSLPMHPAMQQRMFNLDETNSPFKDGIVKYTATIGMEETNKAFLNVISSSGFDISRLYSQITDGGSQAMELVIVGVCGPAGSKEKPILLIDAAYTNYKAMAERTGRSIISVSRNLGEDGKFSLPDLDEMDKLINLYQPGSMVVIPYDNPTGHFLDQSTLYKLASLCIKNNMWMISDEAYRELLYVNQKSSSIWGLNEEKLPGIAGRRISIETTSKVWNACGLRIGALITDNKDFHERAVAEATASLCSNAIGQYIFGALAHITADDLYQWYQKQRKYYIGMLSSFTNELKDRLPGVIISSPDASIYSVVDVRNIAKPNFDALDFVMWCATKGSTEIDKIEMTLLVSPMAEFYSVPKNAKNPGKTQMRIAYVESPENMKKVPLLFEKLFRKYESQRDK